MSTHSFTAVLAGAILLYACAQKPNSPSKEQISSIKLKSGDLITCGPEASEFGTVAFNFSGGKELRDDFQLGVKLLHSFEYDEAEKVFARVIYKEPSCAMAYWGVAMSNFHPLWTPPTPDELAKGAKAVEIAKTIGGKTELENAYINAISTFYADYQKLDHKSRALRFEKAMEEVHNRFPDDKEATIFYALALDAAADPNDKTYHKQKKAGEMLSKLYPGQPNHPGIVHYIIHTYDYPELAHIALPAARKYASVAPSSAHALHMPSHIFTRLGMWDESIKSNMASAESARCYAEAAGIKGHWDEELHAMDYLMYAYLQKGDNDNAKKQLDYLNSIKEVNPFNFKVAYTYAAIPARYALENKLWEQAANVYAHDDKIDWGKYGWQSAILHFTRALGAAHMKQLDKAEMELDSLKSIHAALLVQKDAYKAQQVNIQAKASEAWIELMKGNKDKALETMQEAVALEDATEKHPVTPGEVIPARQLLADMYVELKQHDKALKEYEIELRRHPNRFNAVYGAASAAEAAKDYATAEKYFKHLQAITVKGSNRPEFAKAGGFVSNVKM